MLDYAEGRDFNYWIKKHYKNFDWSIKINAISGIIQGINEIHQKQIVHRDIHTGNILLSIMTLNLYNNSIYISDMGLCGEVGNIDETKIYGIIPYMAPEVLRGKPYTQVADIYSFGMVMYFVATGRQPFANCAHDYNLVYDICKKGVRPEINEPEPPKCYIDLMTKCWDSNPDNRPKAIEICELIDLFRKSYIYDASQFEEGRQYKKQFEEAEEYRKLYHALYDNDNDHDDNNSEDYEYDEYEDDTDNNDEDNGNDKNDGDNELEANRQSTSIHPQAVYTSQSFTPFIISDCLDCEIIN